MLSRYLQYAVLAMSTSATLAQDSVPEDLKTGFTADLSLGFDFNGNSGDGSTFSQREVSKEPSFSLSSTSSNSGNERQVPYTIIMLDTTSDDARVLHYARANFYSGSRGFVSNDDDDLVEYKAPGRAGETGSEHSYAFLLYKNPYGRTITGLSTRQEGSFDVKVFQSSNRFDDAVAGAGFTVTFDESDGEQTSTSPAAEPSSSVAETETETETASAPAVTETENSSTTASTTDAGSSSTTAGSATSTVLSTSVTLGASSGSTPTTTATGQQGSGTALSVGRFGCVEVVGITILTAVLAW